MRSNWLAAEQQAWANGRLQVVGIDEAGRGALAGPVVAACVLLPPGAVPTGVNDSKQLSAKERDQCFEVITSSAIGIGIGIVHVHTIDRINILRATHEAMRAALANLPTHINPDFALIDGLPVHPFPILQRAIIAGDTSSATIAAASIIAKVTRDRLMCELDSQFPVYGFARHKGYGTRHHLRAIAEHGPSTQHRRSFRPVALLSSDSVEPSGQHVLSLSDNDRKTAESAAPVSAGSSNKGIGSGGESVARLYLERLGWRIIQENFRCSAGEIDLIAEEPGELCPILVFVEVKTRRGVAHGSPIAAVDQRKQAKLVAAANVFLGTRRAEGLEPACRFDIAEVWPFPDGLSKVTLHRAAFTG